MNKHTIVHYFLMGILALAGTGGYIQLRQDQQKSSGVMTRQEMDDIMQRMMGQGNETLLPLKTPADRMARLTSAQKGGVKEFILTAEPIRWEYAKGKTITAWGYSGQIPGPEIRVTEGDNVRVVFTNKLPKATTVHWHGIDVPYTMDGVPGISQKPINPGETFTYEFVAQPAGTRFYHTHGSSHQDEAQQLDMGLSGAFIIESRDFKRPDKDITLVLDEWQTGVKDGKTHNMAMMDMGEGHMMNYNIFTINGRAFPDTEALQLKEGERVRVRLINGGTSTSHPIHLHGQSFNVVAVDGNPVPEGVQLTRDTITVAPGERYDIEFVANNPGVWVLHCHELHHADGGMITPIIYEGYAFQKFPSTEINDEEIRKPSSDRTHSMHGQ